MKKAYNDAYAEIQSPNKVMEKYISGKKHIEGQFLFGKDFVIFLGFRDCSWQVFGQKSLEEAIGLLLSDPIWQERIQKAIEIGKKHGYLGPVTFEFLGDYFMECNTRKQFELHTTEETLGDCVSITEMAREVAAHGNIMPYLQRQARERGIDVEGLSAQQIIEKFHELSPVKYCMQARINACEIVNLPGRFFAGTKGTRFQLIQKP